MKKFLTIFYFVSVCLLAYAFSYSETFSVDGIETFSISGAVTSFSSSGLAFNDIEVEVTGTKNLKVKTGRTGNYIVSGLPKGGTYTLTLSKPGFTFQPANKVYRNLDGSKVKQDFVAELATYSISGKVIVGGRPVRNVMITINNRPIKYYTDQDGEYVIDNLEYNGGPYEVSVVSDKHIFEPFKIDSLESNVVHDFRKDITISGRVTSLGQGLADIELDVNGTKYRTDSEGYYKVDSVVSNGDYVVKVVDDKHNPTPASVPIKKITGDRYDVNFSMLGQLVVKVTHNGQPFKNAIITVSDRDQEYKTDAQGTFTIPKMGLNQYYQISVSSEGYQFSPKERVINSLIRESAYQNFKAEVETHSITISVNQGKDPLENVDVTVNNKVYKTDKNGVCLVQHLTYGKKYTITVNKAGVKFLQSTKTIDKLKKDEMVSFETQLSISGTVLSNNATPLANILIICGDKQVKTDASGKYSFKNLEPFKNYTIKASGEDIVFVKDEITISNLSEQMDNIDFTVSVDKKAEAEAKAKAEADAKKAKEEKAKAEAEAKAKAEAEKKAKEEQARLDAEIKKLEMEEKAKAALAAKEEKAKAEAEAKAKAEAEKQAKIEAAKAEQERIKAEKEEAARKAKEEKLRAKEAKEKEIAKAKAKAEAEKKAKEEQARLDAEIKKLEMEEKAKAALAEKEEAERQAKLAKEAKEKEIAEAKAKAEAEKKAKEEQDRLDAEIKKLEMEEKAKAEAEAKAKAEAEKQAKIEAAKAEKERIKAEKERIRAEKEEAARKAKEEKLRAKEAKEKEIAEAKAKAEAEKQAKLEAEEAEKKAKEEQARLDAEIKKLEMEEKAKAALAEKEEAERQAKLAKEAKEKEIAEAKAKAEAEKQAKIEAAKAEKERIKAEKEEAARKAKEEKLRAKLEAEEAARKAKEEKARIEAEAKAKAEAEKQAKLEAEEAAKKAKEEQARLDAEIKKLEMEEKAKAALAEKEEAERQAKLAKEAKEKEIAEAKAKVEAEKQAKLEAAKAEQERIKAEKEEAERLAKEEKLRAKLEAEEAARKAKEEKARIEAEAKAKAEAEKKAKEEQARLDAEIKKLEMEEKAKAALAEKEEAERQAKLRYEDSLKKSKAEKDEQLRKAKEEVFGKNKIKESVAVKGYSGSEDESKIIDDDNESLYIEGRVLKGKVGVKGVQVRLLLSDEEKIFLTDKNGYYKIPELDKGKNYLITVLSGKETLNLSPKSRTYKNLSSNMKKQNFYVVEKIKENKPKQKIGKDDGIENQDWNSKYGIVNKNGVIQKDIHW